MSKTKARIVRADENNFAIQEYVEIVNPKTKEARSEWCYAGYYGHRLDYAVESAILRGFDIGEVVTNESLKDMFKNMLAETRKLMDGKV